MIKVKSLWITKFTQATKNHPRGWLFVCPVVSFALLWDGSQFSFCIDYSFNKNF